MDSENALPLPGQESEPCPVCNMDRFLNPMMTLLVSPCYHKMCESCVNRIFATGSAPCPICKMQLRKNNFWKPVFENLVVEKEYFDGNLEAYNDYLEEVEDIIFNLTNDLDSQEMNAKIDEYIKQNQELIQKNLEKQQNEDLLLQQALKEEKLAFEERKIKDVQEELAEVEEKKSRKNQLLEELATSHEPASLVVQQQQRQMMEVDTKVEEQGQRSTLSILERFEKIQKENLIKRKRELEQAKNVFENPLETSYKIPPTPLMNGTYFDP